MPSPDPWGAYDLFVIGVTVDEIVAKTNSPEAEVIADIYQMRDLLKKQIPGINDDEADRIRHEHILTRQGHADGTAQGLKVAAEAAMRRRAVIDAARARARKESVV
jgi:F0F1-type ATP synthase epsilon subunit